MTSIIISGYGRMGHFVEAALQRRGIELACASEDVCAVPDEVARESVVIAPTMAVFRRMPLLPPFASGFMARRTTFQQIHLPTTGILRTANDARADATYEIAAADRIARGVAMRGISAADTGARTSM